MAPLHTSYFFTKLGNGTLNINWSLLNEHVKLVIVFTDYGLALFDTLSHHENINADISYMYVLKNKMGVKPQNLHYQLYLSMKNKLASEKSANLVWKKKLLTRQ